MDCSVIKKKKKTKEYESGYYAPHWMIINVQASIEERLRLGSYLTNS